jgi:outer membrane protein OmpA-like peptidoglycan-associated protein
MRASFLIVAGVALSLAAPAIADPAYTSGKVVDFLLQSKSSKLGKSRGLHLDEPATAQPEAQPKRFDLMVNFEFDSDRLTAAAQANLDQFAAALKDPRVKENLKGEKFAIDGFTDATGAEYYNQTLSQRRAAAVVNYLQQHGVDRSALIAKGFGPANPRAPDPFDPINRRVETHLVD